MGNSNANKLNDLSRRAFMADTAKALFGVTIGSSLAEMYGQGAEVEHQVVHAPAGFGKAKSVIYLFMAGGLTHIDTFDPKPDMGTATMGKTETIRGASGIELGHYLKGLGKCSSELSVIRSLNSTQGAHSPGRYFMRTGYAERSTITHPSSGGWVNKMKEKSNASLPGFVTVNCSNGHPGEGFFEPSYGPLPVGDATKGLENVKRRKHSTEEKFQKQLDLRKKLDQEFDEKFHQGYKNVRAYNGMYDSAVKLMKSEDLEVFDLSREDQAMHKLYGESNFGKGCLLARRLVEKKVNFVEVELGGFDWHTDNFTNAEQQLPMVDQAVSALINDLKQRGLLDSTLVVLASEFGRTPKINKNRGRDHFPQAFSAMLAGGGVKGGYVHGKTDEKAANVIEDQVDAGDLNATIAHAMGLQHDKVFYSPSKRPFKMGGKEGDPITSVFA